MGKLSELAVYIKKKGLKETINRIKSRYFSITKFDLFGCDLTSFNASSFNAEPDIEYCLGDIDELNKYRSEHPDLPREFYVDQTHGGKEFLLGYFNGELAQICWVFRKGDYSRFFDIVNETSCELNYIITLPKFRGKGLPAKFVAFICDYLLSSNIKKVVVAISSKNVLMIKGMKATKFRHYKTIKSYCSFVIKDKV